MEANTVGVTRQIDKPLFCCTQDSSPLEAGLKATVSVSDLRRCISVIELCEVLLMALSCSCISWQWLAEIGQMRNRGGREIDFGKAKHCFLWLPCISTHRSKLLRGVSRTSLQVPYKKLKMNRKLLWLSFLSCSHFISQALVLVQ